MDFSRVKLPSEAYDEFKARPVRSLKPYDLLSSPVYVHMKLNSKFVMIKRAFDFFTPADFERLAPFKHFYFPVESATTILFRKTALGIKDILQWEPQGVMHPASFEISDAVMKLLSTLWGKNEGVVEGLSVAILASGICYPIPPQLLNQCREGSVAAYEYAILRAGWVVFLALHLGYVNLDFLSELRERILKEAAEGTFSANLEILELVKMARKILGDEPSLIPGNLVEAKRLFKHDGSRAELKLSTRLARACPQELPEQQESEEGSHD